MPLYEYDCEKCQKHLEVIQKFSDAPLQECPDCKGTLVKRLSLTSFQLKGTGWYNTDYRKSSKPSDSMADKAADKTDKGKSAETPGTSEKKEKAKE